MSRVLTSAMQTEIAADGSKPVLLVTLSQRVPGVVRTVRLASRGDGVTAGGYSLGGNTYSAKIASVPRFRMALIGAGGVGVLDGGELVLTNVEDDGTLWSDLLDDGSLDGAELAFEAIFITGSETTSDVIPLRTGIVDNSDGTIERMRLAWLDGATRKYVNIPTEKFLFSDYPYAPLDLVSHRRVKPIVLGDMTGKLFDLATPGSGLHRHVRAPLIGGAECTYFLRDIGTSDDQEDLVVLQDVVCEIPSGSRSLSGDYIQITGNELNAWVPPHRVHEDTTGVDDAPYARSENLDEYAVLETGDMLQVDLPGLPESLGAFGAADPPYVAADYTVYIVHSGSSTPSADFSVELSGTGAIEGPNTVNPTGTVATTSYTVGDHFADPGWKETALISVKVDHNAGTVNIHRVIAKVVFRSLETLSAYEEQRVYRSQLGFSEAASGDYQDGGFIVHNVRKTTPFRRPGDQIEAIARNKNWGLGLRAGSTYYSLTTLYAAASDTDTRIYTLWNISGYVSVGQVLNIAGENVRITAAAAAYIDVERGVLGGRAMWQSAGTTIFAVPTGGEIDCASFLGALTVWKLPTGDELLTNGEFESTTGWTQSDPSAKGGHEQTTDKYARYYAARVYRDADGGTTPSWNRAVTTTSGDRYMVGFWYKTDGSVNSGIEGGVQIDGAVNVLPAAEDYTYRECIFLASGSSTTLYFCAPATWSGDGVDSVYYDEISVRKVTEWQWDHVIDEEIDARSWLDRACPEAKLRIIEDGSGRTAARPYFSLRESADTWDDSVIVTGIRDASGQWRSIEPVKVTRTPMSEICTGVEVRYGWDERRQRYLRSTYVSCREESTGQSVASWSQPVDAFGEITVADTSDIYPLERWSSGEFTKFDVGTFSISGTSVQIDTAQFVTDGVEAGDWFWWSVGVASLGILAVIESVDSETTLTLRETSTSSSATQVTRYFSCFPYLFRAGGKVFVPVVSSGVGSEHATIVYTQPVDFLDPVNLPDSEPEADDVIWKLWSDSHDGASTRDQVETVRANRERLSMKRLAMFDRATTKLIEARRIQDRETAVALRDHTFDYYDRRYLFDTQTDLSTLEREVGDVVTLEHAMVPGDSMRCEIVRQEIDVEQGLIRYRLREM